MFLEFGISWERENNQRNNKLGWENKIPEDKVSTSLSSRLPEPPLFPSCLGSGPDCIFFCLSWVSLGPHGLWIPIPFVLMEYSENAVCGHDKQELWWTPTCVSILSLHWTWFQSTSSVICHQSCKCVRPHVGPLVTWVFLHKVIPGPSSRVTEQPEFMVNKYLSFYQMGDMFRAVCQWTELYK